MTRRWTGLLLAGLVVLAGGCTAGTDDEMAPPPTKTVTASPSQSAAPAPATIPVGRGEVSPTDVVWAQGSVLHVGRREVDLSPTDVESFVVVHGGVFVLSDGELWFTDLARIRGTAQTDVTRLRTSPDADRLEVWDTRSGRPLAQAYDTRTGRALRGDVHVEAPAEHRRGPGHVEVRTQGGHTSVRDVATGRTVPLAGLPRAFELGGWAGDSEFYGVAGEGAAGRSVVTCDVARHRCTRVATVTGSEPVVFGTGK